MTFPFSNEPPRLSYHIEEINSILYSSASRQEQLLFERYLLLGNDDRSAFVLALIGELLVTRARLAEMAKK